jgi:hypothetical protein
MRNDEELGVWLRQQRESRSWARPEMARQLISAARRSGDTSMPGVDSVSHNIYRWERGSNGLTDRYKLHYCRAFGISPDDFGSGQAERPVYQACDTSNDPPVLAFASGDGEKGLGVMIAGALTKEWPYFLLPPGGKVVYCFLEIIVTDSQTEMRAKGTGMPFPILDDIQTAWQLPARLRQALNTLEWEMPIEWQTGSVTEALRAVREELEDLELEEIRRVGPREYLLIKPLAPDAGGEFAAQAAEHVRGLDGLGLVVRLGL